LELIGLVVEAVETETVEQVVLVEMGVVALREYTQQQQQPLELRILAAGVAEEMATKVNITEPVRQVGLE